MRILVLTKRQYMGKDLLDDRFGRFRELPLALARLGHEIQGISLSYRRRAEGAITDFVPSQDGQVSGIRSISLTPLFPHCRVTLSMHGN